MSLNIGRINLKIELADILFYGIVYCFLLYTFEAPIRFYTEKVGLGMIIYTKDIVLLFIAAGLMFRWGEIIVVNKLAIIFFSILLFYGIVAILNGVRFSQVLFAYKIYLIFFIGIQGYRFLPVLNTRFMSMMNWLAFFSCLGLVLNLIYRFPWEGIVMAVGGIEVDTSRTTFAAGGFKRIAGFGRNWSNPAYFALVATALNYSYLSKWKLKSILLILFFFVGILITTNKGAIGAFVLISIFAFIKERTPSIILKLGIISLLAVVIVLPLLSWSGVYKLDYTSLYMRIIFSSFTVRVEEVWPLGLDLVEKHGNLIFGRGIGGIGAAQILFEKNIYHPGDNLFIYMYGIIGLLSLFILSYIGVKIGVFSIKESQDKIFISMILICFLGIGIIGSALENSILNFFFGLMFASLFHQKIKFLRM